MSKIETLQYLEKNGITELAINFPDTKKEWVLEYLDTYNKPLENVSLDSFKEYYKEFIEENFK